MVDGIQTRTLDNNYCVATWDRVLIQVWRGEISREAIVNLERIARAFVAEHGGKISSISIIERTSPPPSDHVRKDLSQFYRDLAPHLHEAIVVPEGGGFRAAIVRGVGIALSTLSPRTLPFKFIDSVRSAAVAAAPYLSPASGGPLALEDAIERVRVKMAGVGAHV